MPEGPRRGTTPRGGQGAPSPGATSVAQLLEPDESSSCAFWSLAAATTHLLYGVPFWPATCFLLRVLQAVVGLGRLVATLAIAVTPWLKGVPFWPATCFLLWPWQFLPYALAFVSALALGPGGVSAVGVCVTAGWLPARGWSPCGLPGGGSPAARPGPTSRARPQVVVAMRDVIRICP